MDVGDELVRVALARAQITVARLAPGIAAKALRLVAETALVLVHLVVRRLVVFVTHPLAFQT